MKIKIKIPLIYLYVWEIYYFKSGILKFNEYVHSQYGVDVVVSICKELNISARPNEIIKKLRIELKKL